MVDINSKTNLTKLVSLVLSFNSNDLRENLISAANYAYRGFIFTAINNKTNYIATAILEEKKLMANFAWEITKLFRE